MYKVTSAGEFTSLYSFCNTFSCVGIPPEVGIIPEYALTQATSGLLFGGTDVGGTHNVGNDLQLLPRSRPPGKNPAHRRQSQ